MLAFEISVNGKRLCTASTAEHCVLSMSVDWTQRDSEKIRFNIGGVAANDQTQHSYWRTPSVEVGDEITIRLVDAESHDQPDEKYHPAQRFKD